MHCILAVHESWRSTSLGRVLLLKLLSPRIDGPYRQLTRTEGSHGKQSQQNTDP